MAGVTRQAIGLPVRLPPSNYTQVRYQPTLGFTDSPDLANPPGSITSGMNVWIWADRLQPRARLLQLGSSNPLGDVPTGAFLYNDVSGVQWPVVSSKATIAYLNGAAWTPLTYVSGVSNQPPTGGQNDQVFATSVYLPRADTNIAVLANGVNPLFSWGGPSNGTALSTLTQAPIAKDVTTYSNRLVAWNLRYNSSDSVLAQRIAWCVPGNPEDWNSVGAGYQDLLDMRGYGTRLFTRVDELMLCTDQEIWRGTNIGPPFDFQFTPFSRVQGVPYPRAAINTPDGFFWVGQDMMVYRLQPYYWSQVEEIGKNVQRLLTDTVGDPNSLHFGLYGSAKQLSLYYTPLGDTLPTRAVTFNLLTGTWTPQVFAQGLTQGFTAPNTSAATVWNQLIGTFGAQTLTYDQLLGTTSKFFEGAVSSTGTTYIFQQPNAQATDDGVPVPSEAYLGTHFAALPDKRKYVDTVRLDLRADTTSTLSVAVSGDLGMTFLTEQSLAVSVQSSTSQQITRWGVDGTYHTVRVRSTGGAWELAGVTVRARIGGESF